MAAVSKRHWGEGAGAAAPADGDFLKGGPGPGGAWCSIFCVSGVGLDVRIPHEEIDNLKTVGYLVDYVFVIPNPSCAY